MMFFEIHLPWQGNDGRSYTGAREAFEALVTQRCGGCNLLRDSAGVWRNEAGRVFYDMVIVCRFATADRSDVVALVTEHQRLFPDQEAIFVAEIGRAWIVDKGQHLPADAIAESVPLEAEIGSAMTPSELEKHLDYWNKRL